MAAGAPNEVEDGAPKPVAAGAPNALTGRDPNPPKPAAEGAPKPLTGCAVGAGVLNPPKAAGAAALVGWPKEKVEGVPNPDIVDDKNAIDKNVGLPRPRNLFHAIQVYK